MSVFQSLHAAGVTRHSPGFLGDVALHGRTHAYLAGICDYLDATALKIGGVEDQVHLLCRMSKTRTIADLVKDLNRDSSKWITGHVLAGRPGGTFTSDA